ncbi:hypothetical protein NLI96_g4221 [Meripilus lineatus]|uniref:Uncharacterized protein n=1 Tax=Meripilus lineatus TaxID=2056292 RepID=A0AAD5V6Y6_9APHY|nr:hypothetical protein NLI96_g4221 [Physisporinus lineatus]
MSSGSSFSITNRVPFDVWYYLLTTQGLQTLLSARAVCRFLLMIGNTIVNNRYDRSLARYFPKPREFREVLDTTHGGIIGDFALSIVDIDSSLHPSSLDICASPSFEYHLMIYLLTTADFSIHKVHGRMTGMHSIQGFQKHIVLTKGDLVVNIFVSSFEVSYGPAVRQWNTLLYMFLTGSHFIHAYPNALFTRTGIIADHTPAWIASLSMSQHYVDDGYTLVSLKSRHHLYRTLWRKIREIPLDQKRWFGDHKCLVVSLDGQGGNKLRFGVGWPAWLDSEGPISPVARFIFPGWRDESRVIRRWIREEVQLKYRTEDDPHPILSLFPVSDL